jgi:hypothetical protein
VLEAFLGKTNQKVVGGGKKTTEFSDCCFKVFGKNALSFYLVLDVIADYCIFCAAKPSHQ